MKKKAPGEALKPLFTRVHTKHRKMIKDLSGVMGKSRGEVFRIAIEQLHSQHVG